MKVNRIPLRFLRNNEFNIYLNKVNDDIVLHDPKLLPIIETLRSSMAGWIPKIDDAIAVDAQSALTKQIIDADLIRDKYVRGMRNASSGYCDYFEKDIESAGKIVFRAFKKYGVIEKKSYVEETGILESLLKETVTNDELHQAIIKLKFEGWMNALDLSNKRVFALHAQRTSERQPESAENVLELRTHAIAVYNKLMRKIDSATELAENGEYNKLIDQLNNIAAEAETILAMRQSSGNNKEGDK